MKDNVQQKLSLHQIRWLTRLSAILLSGLFFVLVYLKGTPQGHHLNPLDVLLGLTMILIILGLLMMIKSDLIAGYMIVISVIHYEILSHVYANSVFTQIEGFYLLIPGFVLIILGTIGKEKEKSNEAIVQLKEDLTELVKSKALTNAMLDIFPQMLRNEDLDYILQRVLDNTIQSIENAEKGSIFIRSKDDRIVFYAAVGHDLKILKRLDIKYQETLQFKLEPMKEPMLLSDVTLYGASNAYPELEELKTNQDVIAKSMLTYHFKQDSEIMGYISVENTHISSAFNTADIKLLNDISKHLELILENHKHIESVYRMLRYDTLTGTYTRRHFDVIIQDTYLKAKRAEQELAVITFDIDDLKVKNDTYGHEVGDAYLIHFTSIIKDKMPKYAFLSRTGGDEFVLVIPQMNLEEAKYFQTKLREVFDKNPFLHGKYRMPVKYSSGLASYPQDGSQIERVIKLSDQRMYLDKRDQKEKYYAI